MMISRRYLNILLAAGACFLALLLYSANLYFGDLNHDEGWYLYASRQVSRGLLPYRDFHFSQSPLMPFVYGFLRPFWGRWGVAGGRFVTACFGLLSAFLATCLAWRLAPPRVKFHASLTCFMLISCNVYQSYFTTIVKSYSLAAAFLCAGFLALSFSRTERALWASGLSGFFLACAAGSRLSTGAVLPIVGLYLIWQHRFLGHSWSWFVFGTVGAFTLAGIFLPWFVLAPEGFLFGMLLHTNRYAGSFLTALLLKAGFVSRCVYAYYVPVVAAAAAGLWWYMSRHKVPGGSDSGNGPARFVLLLVVVVFSISLLHFMSPFPYDDYQVPVFPLFAVIASIVLWRMADQGVADCRDWGSRGIEGRPRLYFHDMLLIMVFLAVAIMAFSSPRNQEWFVRGHDRLWVLKKEKPDLRLLQETGEWIRREMPQEITLLTQDTYLAIEAGCNVPSGLEMGPFSYFPGLSTEKALQFKVLNRELMTNLLQNTDAPLAAFSGYGLAIKSPEMTELPAEDQRLFWKIVRERYELVKTVPHFGQGHTMLTIWKRKVSEPSR